MEIEVLIKIKCSKRFYKEEALNLKKNILSGEFQKEVIGESKGVSVTTTFKVVKK